MRVQRAPHASAQPQPPPADLGRTRPATATVTVPQAAMTQVSAPARFSAEVELDLTDVRRSAGDAHEVMAHVVVTLLAACRAHHLVDGATRLQVLTPSATGWSGVTFEQSARQSVFGIATGLAEAGPVVPDGDAGTLRLVRLDGSGVHTSSDWGLAGLGTLTVGAAAPVARPWAQEPGPGFSIVTRWIARVGLSTAHSSEAARAVVAALAEAEHLVASTAHGE